MRLNEQFLKNAIPHISFVSTVFPEVVGFSIDSRTLAQGDVFIALTGLRVDGHDFIAQVANKGAAGLIIKSDKQHYLKNINQDLLKNMMVVVVPDTRTALMQLATAWREQFSYPVVGITGSVGKTSTKQALVNILDMHGSNYVASAGNQNNLIGLALSILKMRSEHEVAVFEIGINKRGEMSQLVAMAKPTIALITAIGHAHMEGLGSLADIAHEKKAIFALFKESNIGIINGDQALLAQVGYPHPVVKFGSKTTNQVQARKIHIGAHDISFILKLYGQKERIIIKKNHIGAVFNALAAATLAYLLEIPTKIIIQGITTPVVVAGRFEERKLKAEKGTLINDCYNASPESMKASLLAFEHYKVSGQKIAVLGDMLELGINSPFWHRQLGRFLRKVPSLKHVVLVGSLVQWTKNTIPVGVTVEHVPTWQEAIKTLEGSKLVQDSLILVKGSFGVGLGNLVEAITEKR